MRWKTTNMDRGQTFMVTQMDAWRDSHLPYSHDRNRFPPPEKYRDFCVILGTSRRWAKLHVDQILAAILISPLTPTSWPRACLTQAGSLTQAVYIDYVTEFNKMDILLRFLFLMTVKFDTKFHPKTGLDQTSLCHAEEQFAVSCVVWTINRVVNVSPQRYAQS